ncbi:MAG TPA: serine/threonine protein kinase [Planctomycetes bacterium]|nr:serine/threonine protein kinase [Planctomycetota bacterium]
MESKGEEHSLDSAILAFALEAQERGEDPSREFLSQRFPDRQKEIEEVLAALTAYRAGLAEARARRVLPGDEVLASGTELGDFRIVSVLGRGAMGIVYRATQRSLGDREVALKVLRTVLVARDPRFLNRFRREAELASRVHAPHLAEVFGSGEAEGQVFFAMRLVEGPSLAEVLSELARRRRLGEFDPLQPAHVRRVVEVVRDAARGLAALHAAGLVHRDIKPSNILLAREIGRGEARVAADSSSDALWDEPQPKQNDDAPGGASGDAPGVAPTEAQARNRSAPDTSSLAGTATLVDFGLLRPTESSDLTGSLTRLGTPAFAPPELLLGRAATPASDVFSLGVVLYDLIALTPPHQRETAAAGLGEIRARNPAVDERLAAVVRKSLEERPALRYPEGAAFAAELDRYLAREPLQALPASPLSRLRLAARRHPARFAKRAALAASLVLVLATLLGFTPATLATLRAASALDTARRTADLRTAAARSHDLLAHATLAGLLPTLSDELAFARDLDSGPLSPLARSLEAHPTGESGRAHEELLFLYFAEDGARYQDLLLRFLTRELDPASPLLCRLQAARTCAAKFLVDPVHLWDEQGEPQALPPDLQRLRDALVIAANPDPESFPAGDVFTPGEEADRHEFLRMYATGALSGFDFVAYDTLLARCFDVHPEIRRIANSACQVFLRTREREVFNRLDGDFSEVPAGALVRTAVTAWNSTRFTLAERAKGYERYPRHHELFRESDWRSIGMRSGTLRVVSWLLGRIATDAHRAGRRTKPWRDLAFPERLRIYLEDQQNSFSNPSLAVEHRNADRAPEPFAGWPGLPLSDRERQSWNAYFGRSPQPAQPDFDPFEPDFENTWLPDREGNLGEEDLDVSVIEGATGLQLTLEPDGRLHAIGLPAKIKFDSLDAYKQIPGVRGWRLQFARPGKSELRIDLSVPPGSCRGSIHLSHLTPQRAILPWSGQAQVEIRIEPGGILYREEVPLETEQLDLPLTARLLAQTDSVTIGVRYLGIESIYWVMGIQIEFFSS